jgi:TetR/AcrR family transcriptional repressor of lmrAB and yxaGH operons
VSKPGDTRARIVRSATGLFRRQGVTRAGVGTICARAGVTKGVFAHHFPGGKEELLLEVVARNRADVEDAWRGIAGDADAPAMIAGVFAEYAALLRERGSDFGCPVAASVVDVSELSPAVRAAARDAFSAWSARVDVRAGGLGELVVAALEGAILLARAADEPAVVERVGTTLAALAAGQP